MPGPPPIDRTPVEPEPIPTYPAGAVKQDPATQYAAVRSRSADDARNAWFIADIDNGGSWAAYGQVASWVDVPGTPLAES